MEAILKAKNILMISTAVEDEGLRNDFFGTVISLDQVSSDMPNFTQTTVYLCGDLTEFKGEGLNSAARIFVIRELSSGSSHGDTSENWIWISLGQVPINIHGAGVLYRRFFDGSCDYYRALQEQHVLQSLTESTKPNKALRKGIYLTPVRKEGSELHFRLLRCSTNLSGPTEDFRATDIQIVDALSSEAAFIFENYAPLNHVLAQKYINTPATTLQKQTKARISAHADKTKDMPRNAIMAFCTFYDDLKKLRPHARDPFDYGYKAISGLTKLYFRLKDSVRPSYRSTYPSEFTVTLYPNSVFFMPLLTNRLYTHEIQASMLDAGMIPTRLGYVVRCSSTEAVFAKGSVFLKRGEKRDELQHCTPEGIEELRRLYAEENSSHRFIDYGNRFHFSMNAGDYLAPTYNCNDEFRSYALPTNNGIFERLVSMTSWEVMGKGRQGAVLVQNLVTGVPLVRTTSKYANPAQRFQSIHQQLGRQIQEQAFISTDFNNALIEKYTNAYTTMGYHSDQALDLANNSYIAVFSCYEHPEYTNSTRLLVIESKESPGMTFQIPLRHNSVIVFSTDTNRKFKHKIVLESSAQMPENVWLGVTFRTAKSILQFRGEQAYFADGTPLRLANDEERREFYKLRARENREIEFQYPSMTYTVSESDLMKPTETDDF